MNKKLVRKVLVCASVTFLVGGAATQALLASPKGNLHDDGGHRLRVTKECTQYTGASGSFCTITGSNVPQIVVGSLVIYDQAAGVPTGMLDSNVILDAGGGNRAIGRCTLDLTTGLGLCTFSDGTGTFAGFHARVRVSPPTDGKNWHWDGVYGFDEDGD